MTAGATAARGGAIQLAALSVVALAAWAAGFYFRMAPPGAPGTRAVALATGAVDAAPPATPSPAPATSASAPSTSAADAAADAAPLDAGPESDAATLVDAAAETPDAAAEAAADAAADAATVAAPSSDPAAINACITGLLPEDTFASYQPDFTFVCASKYARHGVTKVQAEISKGKWGTGTATVGMQEWAALGWYQLAVYAVMRGRCCAEPEKLEWTFRLACPLDQAMANIERTVREGDRAGANAAISEYTQAATCLTRLGQARNFGQRGMPGAGLNALQRFIDRARP